MQKDIKRTLFSSKLILSVIVVYLVINIMQINVINDNVAIEVIITFFIILFLSIYNILKDKTPYSLNKTFWYFYLIFFFIAPIIQYLTNYKEWNYYLSNNKYLVTNILIIMSQIIFMIFYKKIKKEDIYDPKDITIDISSMMKCVLYILSIMCLVIAIKNVGIANLFSREENTYSVSGDGMFNTIFTHLLKCIPVYAFMLIYIKEKKIDVLSVILLCIIVILNFPTSTTRFWMGAIYIGIFLIVLNRKKEDNRKYDLLIIITFTIIFSFMYNFKFHDMSYFIKNGIEMDSLIESYDTIDYDAYSMIPRAMDYSKQYDYAYGKQVLGTILFWVPRSIWGTKPYPTGQLIVEAQGQQYTNVSCPYIAEGYINFGIIGIIIFQIFLTIICSILDNRYWKNKINSRELKILYPFLMGFLIFIERGALHPAIVYLFCFCIPLILIIIWNRIKLLKE